MSAKFGDSTCNGVDVVLQTDRQTDKQTDRQTDKRTDQYTCRNIFRQVTNRQTDEKSVRDRGLAGIYFLYAILDKYGGRTTWPMTSSLKYFIPHGEFFAMSHVSIFLFITFGDTEVLSFSVFPRWRPNHVTYDFMISIFYSPWRVLFYEPCLNFLYSALLEIWRCKIFRFFKDGGQTTWPMRSSSTYFFPHGEFFSMSHVSIFYIQHFWKWRCKVFRFFQDGGRPTWLMTSSLTYFIPHGEFLAMSHVSIFSIQHFWRYGGARFFGFSKMAAEPRDWWRHH